MSKIVYLCGSRRYTKDIIEIIEQGKLSGIKIITGREDTRSLVDFKEMLKAINNADVVYVFSKDGYIGNTVCLEIGYAYFIGKLIISSEKFLDVEFNIFIDLIMNVKDFIDWFNRFKIYNK